MKKTALVFEVYHHRGWYPVTTVASHKEAEELARERARIHANEAGFDPLSWRVRRISIEDVIKIDC